MIFFDGEAFVDRIRDAKYRSCSMFYRNLPEDIRDGMNRDTFLRYIRRGRMPEAVYDACIDLLDISEYYEMLGEEEKGF